MSLIGKTVADVRLMTDEEKEDHGWESSPFTPTVVVFDDGTLIYPSMDEEGNGPGTMFGITADDEAIYVIPDQKL